ncbi:MAG TPA: SPFH domain-containing protein [Gemmataceae bacterium]|nr:SPFH domain-containing protein [Gemmataceae bacterium]
MRYVRLALLLLLIGYLLTGLTPVRPGERAVVRRFGRVLEEKPEPGLWIGLPWGMDVVDRVPVDLLRPVDVGYRPNEDDGQITPSGQLLTGDHNLVNVRVVVHFRVKPDEVEDYVAARDPDGTTSAIDRCIGLAVESLLAEWVASRDVDEVLLHGKAELPRWLLDRPDQPDQRLEKRLEPYRLGVEIAAATVTYLSPPGGDVKDAFDRVTEAQATVRTWKNEAESWAREIVRQKESEQFKIKQLALAYEREQFLQATAETESFEKRRAQYEAARRDNPGVLAAMWWDRMGEVFVRLRANGRLDLLDHHLGRDGLNLIQVPPLPPKNSTGPK